MLPLNIWFILSKLNIYLYHLSIENNNRNLVQRGLGSLLGDQMIMCLISGHSILYHLRDQVLSQRCVD
jgi:hypothetical protein